VTFGFAISAVPISGSFCPGNCIEYPYLDSLANYPKDYIWMFLAIVQLFIYLVFILSIYYTSPEDKKIASAAGVVFSIVAAIILMADYFVQFSVIPVSLKHNETEGIAILTQYNPHGIFIALEEIGYIAMSFSLAAIAFAFTGKSRLETYIRWIFLTGFIAAVVSFSGILIRYGIEREYRFEIVIISINWLVLLIGSLLLAKFFRKRLNSYNQIKNP
jgi:heme/copper-type cytochrome/quinol oxidase subunit 4